MRLVAVLTVLVGLSMARAGRTGERRLEVEAEVLGAAGKSLGKLKTVVAARDQGKTKASFGSLVVTMEVDVGPTFLKDCNLTTVQVTQHDPAAVDGKHEGRTTIQACGVSNPPATLPGATAKNKVVVSVRLAP